MRLLFGCLPRPASKKHKRPSTGTTCSGNMAGSPQPAAAGQQPPAASRCADAPRYVRLHVLEQALNLPPPEVRAGGTSRPSSPNRLDGSLSAAPRSTRLGSSSWAAALAAAPCSVEQVEEFFRHMPGRAVIVMSLQAPEACAPSCKVLRGGYVLTHEWQHTNNVYRLATVDVLGLAGSGRMELGQTGPE